MDPSPDPITTPPSGVTPSPRPKWYYNVWFVLAMLFFVLGPFGLPLVWKSPTFSRGIKIALTLVMAAYTVLLIDFTLRMGQAIVDQANALKSTFAY